MADLLFFPLEQRLHRQIRLLYAQLLTDVARSASDPIDALELFRALLLGGDSHPDSLGFMAFDAHGGDTACHLRAGMLLEVFSVHRQMIFNNSTGKPKIPVWIDRHIELLKNTAQRAKDLCAALTKDRVHPTKLGIGAKEDTAEHILSVLGWEEPVFGHSPESIYCEEESCSEARINRFSASVPAEANSDFPVLAKVPRGAVDTTEPAEREIREEHSFPTRFEWNAEISSYSSPRSPSSATTASSASSTSSEPEILSYLRTQWDLLDTKSVVRFLVFSYILSKYKTFFCMKDIVGARLYPEGAFNYGYELMVEYWDFKNVEYKKAKLERVSLELRALQTWLSDYSCAWLQSLAARFSPTGSMSRLLLGTVQKSAKGLTAAACYPGYLLLRNELSRTECTIIMIDRHFCSHGIHLNAFLATLDRPDLYEPNIVSRHRHINWTVKYTTLSELRTAPGQSTPHAVVMGNSINGSHADYISRLSTQYTPNPIGTDIHEDHTCAENLAQIQAFTEADHDRLGLSFFAAHKAYSFPLAGAEDETQFVGSKMDETYPGLREWWMESRGEIAKLGGGEESLRMFGWQHMFVETKGRVARKLETWSRNRDLMPLSADITASRSSEGR